MTVTPNTVASVKAKKAAKAKVVLSPKALRAVKTFAKAKADAKLVAERQKRAEAILRAELGEGFEVGTTEDGIPVVTVMHSSNSKIDQEVLEQLFPGAVAASKVSTAYTYLKTA